MIEEVFHPAVEDVPLSRVLTALADPARLAIVRALAHADEGLACTLLPQETGLALSPSTMSHHQRNLREAGITLTRIYGNRRVLRLRREELDQRFPGLLEAILAAPGQPGTAVGGQPQALSRLRVHSHARASGATGNATGSGLRLRPLRGDDEAAFLDALQVMAAEEFTFGFGLEPGADWGAYLTTLEDHRCGRNLLDGQAPDTFLVAEVAGTIVGRTSIRHELNESLERRGGHIGYCVLPGYRRRGYATEILRQSLIVTRAIGVDRVLVTCGDDNAGSIAVIEGCGGKLDSVVSVTASGPPTRRYWIA